MAKSFGFGIIGTGAIASFHAEAIKHMEKAALVACYDLNPLRADDFATRNGIKSYHDISLFLADPDIDIVTITTPSGAHLEPALEVIKAHKKALIIEKPLEITTERCDEIISAARKNGVVLSGIFQSRFHEAARIIKRAIEENRFGKISIMDAQIKWFRSQEYYDSVAWHGTKKMDGGGALMNQGIHAIDLLRWFSGPVKDVSAKIATVAHERIEVEDTAVASLTLENGALATIEGTTAAYPGFLKRIEICGSEGSAILEEESIKFWQFKEEREEDSLIRAKYSDFTMTGGGASDPSAIGWHGHKSVFEDVVNALIENREPEITGEEARKAVELIEAIYKSANENRTISFKN